ncbi:hypothetical protein U1Q18_006970 [Sarracenia purpurea var. burkii]
MVLNGLPDEYDSFKTSIPVKTESIFMAEALHVEPEKIKTSLLILLLHTQLLQLIKVIPLMQVITEVTLRREVTDPFLEDEVVDLTIVLVEMEIIEEKDLVLDFRHNQAFNNHNNFHKLKEWLT